MATAGSFTRTAAISSRVSSFKASERDSERCSTGEGRASTRGTGSMTRDMGKVCTHLRMGTIIPDSGKMMSSTAKGYIIIMRQKFIRNDYILKERYKRLMNDSIVYIITNKLLLLLTHLFIYLRLIKLHDNLINLSLLPPRHFLIDFLLLTPPVYPCGDPHTPDEQAEHKTHHEYEHDEHLKRGHVPDAVHLCR